VEDPSDGSAGDGIDDAGGYDSLVVEDGTVANYDYDVYLYGSTHSTIERIHLVTDGSHQFDGVYAEYTTASKYLRNTSAHAQERLYIFDGSNNLVANNKVEDAEYGVDVEYENGTVVKNNSVTHGYSSTYGLEDYVNYNVAWHDNVSTAATTGCTATSPRRA
jgi:parallel beta-helix repeat protein